MRPNIKNYDIALQIVDGQVVRYDVTWGVAKYVWAATRKNTDKKSEEKTTAASSATTYQKVSAGVLTFTGTTGLVLRGPEHVPCESHEFVGGGLREIFLHRRTHLGPTAAPVAVGSERDKALVFATTEQVFPELVAHAAGDVSRVVLPGLDPTHVFHRFVRAQNYWG